VLAKLKLAGISVDISLRQDTNPSLQMMYKRYVAASELIAKVNTMVTDRKWQLKFGRAPNQTELINIFVAKTTWHNIYTKNFPKVAQHPKMQAWLEDASDCESDFEVWGEVKNKYVMADLVEWLKSPPKSAKKGTLKSSKAMPAKNMKGKEKEVILAVESGPQKGKEKKVDPELAVVTKKSHKKKAPGASKK